MNSPERSAGRPHLRVVRDPEVVAIEDKSVRTIEAYCDELLIDEAGNIRDEAIYNATPFRHSVNKWSHVRFRREKNGYDLTCFGDNRLADVVYKVSMQPYHDVQGAPPAPSGADWLIEFGTPSDRPEWGYSFDPAEFVYCLEEIWGKLPVSVRENLGLDNPKA